MIVRMQFAAIFAAMRLNRNIGMIILPSNVVQERDHLAH